MKEITIASVDPMTISINKEYFRKRFRDVLQRYYVHKHEPVGDDLDEALEELMKCFDGELRKKEGK
jgi:molecular chaperone GrpE (heat shock protein)